jgi:hypothetical protein
MNLRQIARKFQAVVALFALLATGATGLTESLAASTLPACCNTVFCPLHRGQSPNLQKDKTNCDAQGNPLRNDSSMRACDTMPTPVVGTTLIVLVAPLAMRSPASAEPTQMRAPQFFPTTTSIPLTPPPRTLPS